MARQKFTFKWQDKSVRVKMARLKCTFKWQGKSVRLDEKTKVYV